ncbi:TPA: hypothetical protein HA251_02035 [Candidatus Woesearchaeota archaeon]|nr:hypothetical protein [Candidatus Woesearchaeota archaeon]
MTEPLNITIDRLSGEYDRLRKRCEGPRHPEAEDVVTLLDTIKELNKIGLNVPPPRYCIPHTGSTEALVIEKLPDVYRLHGVQYSGRERTVDITRKRLDKGKKKSQDEWMTDYPYGFFGRTGVPDTEIYFNIAITLDDNKNHPITEQRTLIEELRYILDTDFNTDWMMTSTRIESGSITHQYSTPHAAQYSYIDGNDDWLMRQPNANILAMALGGYMTATQINQAAHNITGRNTFLWTSYNDVRVLVLGVFNDRFNIYASNNLNGNRPARGVAIHEKTDSAL